MIWKTKNDLKKYLNASKRLVLHHKFIIWNFVLNYSRLKIYLFHLNDWLLFVSNKMRNIYFCKSKKVLTSVLWKIKTIQYNLCNIQKNET